MVDRAVGSPIAARASLALVAAIGAPAKRGACPRGAARSSSATTRHAGLRSVRTITKRTRSSRSAALARNVSSGWDRGSAGSNRKTRASAFERAAIVMRP